jgi:hypothetical protein
MAHSRSAARMFAMIQTTQRQWYQDSSRFRQRRGEVAMLVPARSPSIRRAICQPDTPNPHENGIFELFPSE